ncbi:MAG: N-acetylmuramoyl-L-alanine amidase [Phycisphaerales bacterium]|nr:MAG: N-acetylmuramoyl-L-alanine amidase [Phycisphaerales bacterium]
MGTAIANARTHLARLRRPQVVWLSLLASMTLVGGGLVALEGPRSPRSDGLALVAPGRTPSATGIEAVFRTRSELDRDRWARIVIHDSGSHYGSPESIASVHESRNMRGLGYHFVIGNGAGAGDGELFVGYRWLDQLPGAHAGGPDAEWHNQRAIGICLVGDGDRRPFSRAQMQRLADLVAALSRELGIPADQVVLHREIAPTSSPGRLFPESALRERLLSLR